MCAPTVFPRVDKKVFADCGQINGVGSALEAAEMRTWKGEMAGARGSSVKDSARW